MKIIVISNYNDYHTTRPEAEIFKGLHALGHNIVVLTPAKSVIAGEFRDMGIQVVDFFTRSKFNRADIQFIRDKIVSEKADILMLFYSKAIVNGIQAAKGVNVKVVLYRGYSGNIQWYDPFAYIKYLNPRVDKIFCNSIGVEEMFQRQLFLKKSKLVTINKGHKLEWYQNYTPYDIRAELNIPSDALLLVNVGNNRRMKGISYLLKSLNMLPDNSNIHLLLIGRDMDTPENLRLIEKCKNKAKVYVLGFRKDVLNIVASTDVFVLSSIKGESITKSVIEAMALGKPAIISDIPGNKELVIQNKNGLIFKSKDYKQLATCILQFYNDRSMCNEYGINAQKHIAENLHSDITIRKTEAMLLELLQ